jgi:Hpt domain
MSKSTISEFVFSTELDRSFLQSLYEGDLQYAIEVFENFLIDTKKEVDELKNLYQENDVKKIRHKLHKVKPTFAFVGLTSLTEEVEEIISSCDRAENISEVEPGCSNLLSTFENSFGLIQKELERMKNHVT